MTDVCHAFWADLITHGFVMQFRLGLAFFLTSALFTSFSFSSGTLPEEASSKEVASSPLKNTSHCPSPADIVFNPENNHWEAPLTRGMPDSWEIMRSISPSMEPESKVSFIFKQASIDKEQGVYYLSCHYQAADLSGEKSFEVLLEPERVMLMNGTLALPVYAADGHWDGVTTEKQHKFDCKTYYEKCEFRIPQLLIRRQSKPSEPMVSGWDFDPGRLVLGPLTGSAGEKDFIAQGKEEYVYPGEDFLGSTDRTGLLRGETESMEDTYDIIKRLYDPSSGDVEQFEPCLDKEGFKVCGCTDVDLQKNIRKDSFALINVLEQFNNNGSLTGFSCKLIVIKATQTDAPKDKH